MKDKRLLVSLPSRIVGELTQSRAGAVDWQPDAAWEREGQEPRLGLDFLRTPGRRRVSSEIPSWFENLLPDKDSTLRARLCAVHGLRDGQSFALLLALGAELPGAVEVRAAPDRAPTSGKLEVDAVEEASFPADANAVETLRLSALSGVQLKFSMSMIQDRLSLGAKTRGAQWIVKIPGTGFEELSEVETATMTWARAAGFDVPNHATVPFDRLEGIPDGWVEGSAPVFAIERFDRRADGARVHQEDLCQALALRPANKYGDQEPGVSFEGALRLVTDACGEEQGREMARRCGFNIAAGNGDAHLKNWSLLWGEKARPTLAPCYDMVATISWEKLGWTCPGGPRLALRVDGTNRFSYLDADRLARSGAASGCPWAKDEMVTGIVRARDAWRVLEAPVPARMRIAVETHWARVPILKLHGPLGVTGS